ncbi:hypothetical protein [Flavisolibacter tropicus]|uniref:Outer membrane protein beta-barrel domain-containing protein n=1 Tax=Flavisolibacter tropicus TaxID=1492898 RepID=A0A172TUH5_9BACT|nr:hypothetical protein [Flavisolibacter tropicus]ANE50397.1 hypothetical protein SY85_07715 [Flavisolibacter tropicus]
MRLLLILGLLITGTTVQAQLQMAKVVGKNADKYKLGFGAFAYYDFPLNEVGNQSARLELMDLAFFPVKNKDVDASAAYVSIKLGYKHIFSETKTGFYLEPQAGYCRVVVAAPNESEASHGDGIAAALEGGYSLEVGQAGNVLNFGLKYETDRAGKEHTLSSVGLRLSYSFNLFRRRE